MEKEYLEAYILSNDLFRFSPLREKVEFALKYLNEDDRRKEELSDSSVRIVEDCLVMEEESLDYSTKRRKVAFLTSALTLTRVTISQSCCIPLLETKTGCYIGWQLRENQESGQTPTRVGE
jgi:hypothetical protein